MAVSSKRYGSGSSMEVEDIANYEDSLHTPKTLE